MKRHKIPDVPLDLAEIMFVALSHVIDYLERHGEYPVGFRDNIKELLNAYEHRRDRVTSDAGVPLEVTRRHTAFVTASLAAWIDGKATRRETTADDFEAWAKELLDGTDS